MKFDFNQELEYAQTKLNEAPYRIDFLFDHIKAILNYAKKKEKKGFESSEIFDNLYDEIFSYIEQYVNLSGTGNLQKQYNTLELYENNNHLTQRDYNLINTKELPKEITEQEIQEKLNQIENEEEWNKFILQLTLRDLKITKEEAMQIPGFSEFIKLNSSKQKQILKMINNRKEIEKYIKLCTGTEIEQLQTYIKYTKNQCETQLKQRYIEILKLAGNFLKEFDFLEEELKLYEQTVRKLSMQGMNYHLKKEEKTDPEDIALEEIFEEETLKNFSLEELALLNLFWQNRFVKRIKDVSSSMFAMRTMSSEDKEIQLTDKKIQNVIYKELICNNIFLKVSRNLQKNKQCKTYELPKTDKEFIKEYEQYFNEQIPDCDNNFMQDINVTNIYGNIEFNAYNAKINTIKFLVQDFLNNNTKVTNWGVIPEKEEKNKNYIIIGIDYPGFNMPVKVHISKKELEKWINYLQGNTILPIYNGANDMTYRGKAIKTNILMPLTKKRQEYIIDKVAKLNPVDLKYLIITHLGNFVTIKNKKTKKIYPEKYIDIETGKTGIKINRKFIEDKECNTSKEKDQEEISQK